MSGEDAQLVKALGCVRTANDYVMMHRDGEAHLELREASKLLFQVLADRGITPERIAEAAR